jgi:class 3 adenylate cyclase
VPREHAQFCHGCGSPVEDAGIRAEYKQVTVLFADVVHSMDIAAAVGTERLHEIMADLADRCAEVVRRYGGTVDKLTGHGIMALFGAPVALEDHAVRACIAALGIQWLSRMAATVFGPALRSDTVVASGGQLGAVGAVGVRARRVLIQPAAQ